MAAPTPGPTQPPPTGVNLAKQYEEDKSRIIKSCFSKPDKNGIIPENYITHVRIIEDSHYPSSRPPPNSSPESKKQRTLIISYLKTGPVRVHKARENADGSFQIGKTWNLIDLTKIENDQLPGINGFKMHFNKVYYWQTNSPREKMAFLGSVLNAYRKYTRGKVPEMVGLDPNLGVPPAQRPLNANAQSMATPSPTPAPAPAPAPAAMVSSEQSKKELLSPSEGSIATSSTGSAGTHARHKSTSEFLHKPVVAASAVVSSMAHMIPHHNKSKDHNKSKERPQRPPSPGGVKSLMSTAMYSPSQNTTPPTTPTVGEITPLSSPITNGPPSPGKQKRGLRNSPSISSLSSRMSQSSISSKLTRSATSIFPSKKSSKSTKPVTLDDNNMPQLGDSSNFFGISPAGSDVSLAANLRGNSSPIRSSTSLSTPNVSNSAGALEVSDGPGGPPAVFNPSISGSSSPSMAAAFKATFNGVEPPRENLIARTDITQTTSLEIKITKTAPASMAATLAASMSESTSISEPPTRFVKESESEPKLSQTYEADAPMTKNLNPDSVDEDMSPLEKRRSAISDMNVYANRKSFQDHHENNDSFNGLKSIPYVHDNNNVNDDFDSDVTDEEFIKDRRMADERFDTESEGEGREEEEQGNKRIEASIGNNRDDNYKREAEQDLGQEDTLDDDFTGGQSQIDVTSPRKSEIYPINKKDFDDNPVGHIINSEADALALEGFLAELNWNGRDDSEQLEKKINAQQTEIESAVISSIIGVDSRLGSIEDGLDKAIKECETLDMVFSIFSSRLGAFSKDISHIESQGEGLQVKAVNQKHLYDSLQNILRKANVSATDYSILLTTDLNDIKSIQTMECTLNEIYGIIKDFQKPSYDDGNVYIGEMKIMRDKDHGYEQILSSFITRFKSDLTDKLEKAIYSAESKAVAGATSKQPVVVALDKSMDSLFIYSSVVLFLQDIDPYSYQSLLKSYENITANYFNRSFATFFSGWLKLATRDDTKGEQFWFSHKEDGQQVSASPASSTPSSYTAPVKSMKRSHTLARLKSAATGDFKESKSVPLPHLPQNFSSPKIRSTKKKELFMSRLFMPILSTIRETLMIQNEILIQFFHLSSFAQSDFTAYINEVPIANRKLRDFTTTIREADTDRLNSSELFNVLKNIFATLDKAPDFFHELLLYNPIECPSLLIMIEKHLADTFNTNQEFLNSVYLKIHARICGLWSKFVEDQIRSINQTLISSKKRRYILNFIRVFPEFCEKIESQLTHETSSQLTSYKLQATKDSRSSRALIDESYEKISKAIFYNLQRIAKDTTVSNIPGGNKDSDSTDYEDKNVLNHHILMVENMNYWTENLDDMDNETLNSILTQARLTYGAHVGKYVHIVIHRPLGKLMDFIEATDALRLKDPKVNLASKHNYGKSAFKRALSGYEIKEIRKSLDVLHKRVEKHFSNTGDGYMPAGGSNPTLISANGTSNELVGKVWRAIQAEYVGWFNRVNQTIATYYKDTSVGLDFTKQDLVAAFQIYK